jgi:2-polyprenyl-3-methyl-5-hydroxy-6-metoxy-1,4-benzoquinol methylase
MRFSHDIAARRAGRHQRCQEAPGELSGRDILDLGCSFGWFEEYAVGAGARLVVGLEPPLTDLCGAPRAVPAAAFLVADAVHLLFGSQVFETTTMFDAIEHLPRGTEASLLAEVRRALAPDGTWVLSTPLRKLAKQAA